MTEMRRCMVVVVCWAWWATPVSARDWKDGCPPYVRAFDPAHAPRAADFGTSADVDSALGPSRLTLSGRAASLSAADGDPLRRSLDGHLLAGRAVLALNFNGPSLMFAYAYGAHDGTQATGRTLGTLMTYVGFRRTGLVLGDALRVGSSLRIGMGSSPSISVGKDGSSPDGEHAETLARASPFESEAFAFDRPVVVSLESRIEVVGCYAPFLALRADVVEWREGFDMPRSRNASLWALPLRLTVGGFVTKPSMQVALALEAGFELRSSALGYHRTGRVRVLVELPMSKLRFGIYGGGFFGDSKGGELGVVTSVGFDGGSVLQ
ncbi:MAG: hypothetical protein E6J90_19550 [Deltaproteobacteria bacterium]|nr:MAG: hypothetical protein E6J91_35080 [Deltaproteobacteria bacterium]TMQ18674.1 MAG: hypothetical protein E6J90_19550 [Deltaproteobacteria bacterium]